MGRNYLGEKRIYHKIYDKLVEMELNDTFCKQEFVKEHHGFCDYFKIRSWDVSFIRAKKMLPNKKFVSRQQIIERIK